MSDDARSIATSRDVSGVRLPADHTLSKSVHAFRQWTGERTLETWCGIAVDLQQGGLQTRETISCLACPEASWRAFRSLPPTATGRAGV